MRICGISRLCPSLPKRDGLLYTSARFSLLFQAPPSLGKAFKSQSDFATRFPADQRPSWPQPFLSPESQARQGPLVQTWVCTAWVSRARALGKETGSETDPQWEGSGADSQVLWLCPPCLLIVWMADTRTAVAGHTVALGRSHSPVGRGSCRTEGRVAGS